MTRQAAGIVAGVLAGVAAMSAGRPPAPAPDPHTQLAVVDIQIELFQYRNREKDAILRRLADGELRLADAVRACERVDERWPTSQPEVRVAAEGRSHGERLADALRTAAALDAEADPARDDDSRCELTARLAAEWDDIVASGELLPLTGPGD